LPTEVKRKLTKKKGGEEIERGKDLPFALLYRQRLSLIGKKGWLLEGGKPFSQEKKKFEVLIASFPVIRKGFGFSKKTSSVSPGTGGGERPRVICGRGRGFGSNFTYVRNS